jgi:DivIVA domain-containing protein
MTHNQPVRDDRATGLPDTELPTVSWAREGYQAAEVDAFVERVRQALGREPVTMAPYEVADQRFKVSRFGRRYALRSVDAYLDTAQQRLRQRHRDHAVADLEGRAPQPRHHRTGWIYLVALVLVAAMVIFMLTQL